MSNLSDVASEVAVVLQPVPHGVVSGHTRYDAGTTVYHSGTTPVHRLLPAAGRLYHVLPLQDLVLLEVAQYLGRRGTTMRLDRSKCLVDFTVILVICRRRRHIGVDHANFVLTFINTLSHSLVVVVVTVVVVVAAAAATVPTLVTVTATTTTTTTITTND